MAMKPDMNTGMESRVTTPEAARVLAEARTELARLPRLLAVLLRPLDDSTWRARPAPGRWSPLEIICHLRDEEVEDFGARLRVVLAGKSEFDPIDPEGWVKERRYQDQDPGQALAAFEARRTEALEMLARANPAHLERSGSRGTVRLSGLDILAAWTAHDLLHLRQLAGTLARVWATRWSPLRADYAGPLPYPPGESKS